MSRFGYVWPSQLDCNTFPNPKDEICVGRNNSTTTPTRPKKTIVSLPIVASQHRCQTLTINACKGLSYSRTLFPNFENHRTQGQADALVNHFKPLFKVKCSPDLKYFICTYYAPVCNPLGKLIKPCKSLCETARNDCRHVMSRFGYAWPSQLDCNKFPNPKDGIFVGRAVERNNSTTTPTRPKKTIVSLPIVASQHRCQTLRINACKGLSYSRTLFPNFENHRRQRQAGALVNHFKPLFKVKCSPDLKYFICTYYAPVCNPLGKLIKPCKSLCETARNDCRHVMSRFGYVWPSQLDCNKFPNPKDEICVGRNNSTTTPTRPKKTIVSLPIVASQPRCQTLTIEACKGLSYSRTLFPNFENHRTQGQAGALVNHFKPLFKVKCSPDLKYFICTYYAPVCNPLGKLIKPCKSLCENARNDCRHVMSRFGYVWPSQLDCNTFPNPKDGICVGRNNSTTTPTRPKKTIVSLPIVASQPRCQTLTIEACKGLNYNRTLFPNFENHRTQGQADSLVNHFKPLFKVKCSPDLKYFICTYYAPVCNALGKLIKPCKSLCENARNDCRHVMSRFGYVWPSQLDCNTFPNPKDEICVGRNNSTTTPTRPKKTIVSLPIVASQHRCQTLTINACKGLSYSRTLFPNFENHRTQGQAGALVNHFKPLFKVKCSPDLKYFICTYYAPVCNPLGKLIKPCKSLCENARNDCRHVMSRFGYVWPSQLDCNTFPNPKDEICVGRNNSTTTPTRPKKTIVSLPIVASQHRCQTLTINACKGLSYSRTLFPNFENHRTQGQADALVNHFKPLFKVKCSPDLKYFICTYYAPVCNPLGKLIKPCKSLCETARNDCRHVMSRFGYAWPSQLDCNKFPNPKDGIFVGRAVERNNSTTTPTRPKKTIVSLPIVASQHRCQTLRINACKGLSYSRTLFPNFENHRRQRQAGALVNHFKPLFKVKCSPDLKYFICTYYAPVCNPLGKLIKPCKSLCETARNDCRHVMSRFGYVWPSQLDCNKFPNPKDEICVGRNNSTTTPTRPKKTIVSLPIVASQHRCQTLTINACKGLSYSRTLFPNFENHRTQGQAGALVNHFKPLFKVKCSPDLKYFICTYYAPVCNPLGKLIKPCKSLCENARNDCRHVMSRFGYVWPSQLDCNKFPNPKDGICVGRNNSTTTPTRPKKTIVSLPIVASQPRCQTLTIEACKGLNYNRTLFPNFENHRTQRQADALVNHFKPLFKVKCSPDLKYFICTYYAPVCNPLGKLIKPCKSLCENARNDCRHVMSRFGYVWPSQLDCNKFPNPKDGICVGRNNSTTTPTRPKKTIVSLPIVASQPRCQTLTIEACKGLNYNRTLFPNFENHRTQRQADALVNHFKPLFKVKCSPDLKYFICTYYAPVCNALGRLIKPCKSLCETARNDCRHVMSRFGYAWPSQLDCNKFPDIKQQICVGRNNSRTTPARPKTTRPT
ncbi:uncharacterized protein LOC113826274 [Paramuricea clavata]|uniref:Uncharacterized protein LOC113826274 n=1 Tax=Paramuricea clavata TaxID=317549 RepID=A0A7D9HKF1_PARCT|nr:uncharacterized protein LOC113826274 [Paramuricea clavata]